MQSNNLRNRIDVRLPGHSRWLPWPLILVCTVAAALAGAAQSAPSRDPDKPPPIPEANRLPDAGKQSELREPQTKKQNFDAAAERRKQLAEDSARLLKLANDLKAEVDKTNKDTLSLNVIRKAEEIEKLARNLKEKMKFTVGAN